MSNFSGFLPFSRASFLIDFVVLAMTIIIPIMLLSMFLVRYKKNYMAHRNIQITLGIVLGITIIFFELDIRLNGWKHLAEVSPYYDTLVFPSLFIHLAFAIPTLILWIITIIGAIKTPIRLQKMNFHKIMGRSSVFFLIATTVTGWVFFWLAFVA